MTTSRPPRLPGLDIIRAVAVLEMFVAHTTPTPGPLGVLRMTNYYAAALFAAVIGASAVLGRRSDGFAASLVTAVARGAVLFVVGVALVNWPSQIDIVLPYLGLLLIIATLLSHVRSLAVGLLALVLFALNPMLFSWGATHRPHTGLPIESGSVPTSSASVLTWLNELFLSGPSYRLTELTLMACLGIVLIRRWGAGTRRREQIWVSVVALVASAVLKFGDKGGFIPYDGSYFTVLFSSLGVVATFGLCLLATPALPALVREAFVGVGQMAFTLYVLQVLGLGWYTTTHFTDNTWPTFVATIVGSFLLAAAWRRLVPAGRWHRGPLEGLLSSLRWPVQVGSRAR